LPNLEIKLVICIEETRTVVKISVEMLLTLLFVEEMDRPSITPVMPNVEESLLPLMDHVGLLRTVPIVSALMNLCQFAVSMEETISTNVLLNALVSPWLGKVLAK
jgi:hypothetical protein